MKRDLKIPKVTFRVRTGDEVETDGGCAIGGQWINKTTDDFFKNKRVVLFSLPGAFTPTCSSQQLPGFEKEYDRIRKMGIDEIYCLSVNDAFVMFNWCKKLKIKNKITFQNISYSYPERGKVIDDLSLSIEKGSVIGIIGASGKGKTTFLRIVTGLLDISKGKFLIDDEVDLTNEINMRKEIFIFSSVILFSLLLFVKNKKSAPMEGKSINEERIGKFII